VADELQQAIDPAEGAAGDVPRPAARAAPRGWMVPVRWTGGDFSRTVTSASSPIMMKALRIPLLWLALVIVLGSAHFGAQSTGPWVIPALMWIVPWATPRELQALHVVVRKLGHLTEYAVLARVWLHGLLAWRRVSVRVAAWAALLVCAACAFLDEAHQSMLPSRTGSVGDAVLDCLGALMMLMMLRARYTEGGTLRGFPQIRDARAAGTPELGG
jgi:VanZ family protein